MGTKGKKQTKKSIRIKIVPKFDENIRKVYSNYVNVSRTPYDIVLRFGHTPPVDEYNLKEIKKTKAVESPITTEVTLPYEVAEELITAIKVQVGKTAKK